MSEAQKAVLLAASGVSGLLIGSFLNVVIFRLPRNCMSIVRPRSRCPKCLTPIAAYDNIPVLSFILLGGKCRRCRAAISPRYAGVELLTGALFLYAAWIQLYGPGHPSWRNAVAFAWQAWFLGTLIACTFIDFDLHILPDELTLAGILAGLAASAAFPFLQPGPMAAFGNAHVDALAGSAFGAFVGGGTVFVVDVFGRILFRKRIARAGQTRAMYAGDLKYLAMFGSVLGWRGVLLSFILACVFGSVFGIAKLIFLRRMGYAPFGPFLSLGALSMLFWERWVNRAIQAYLDAIHRLGDALVR
jgi:leader peptidase (prepilin peptidase)/N-methyltransferase